MIWLFFVVVIAGFISSRTTVIAARSGVLNGSMPKAALGFTATLVTYSMFVWGFASVAWYWPIIAFGAGVMTSATVVGPANWSGWRAASPLLDLLAISGGLTLWIFGWPF